MAGGGDTLTTRAARRYLELAAARVVGHRDLASTVLAGVRAPEVMRRTRGPRTTFYRWWAGQAEMRDDLLLYLLTTEPLVTPPDRPTGAWRDTLADWAADMRTAPGTVLRTTLLAFQLPPRVELLLAWRVSTEIDALARLLERVLAHEGRAAQAPLTTKDLAATLYLVADGSAHAARVAEGADRVQAGSVPMVVHAAEALLAACTRPRTGGDHVAPVPEPPPPSLAWPWQTAPALAAGAEIFRERLASGDGLDDPFGDLTVATLARTAGVARSSVSAHWSNQPALNLAVLGYVTQREAEVVHDIWQRAVHAAAHEHPQAPHTALDRALDLLAEAPPIATRAALAFTNRLAVAPIRAVLADAWQRSLDRQVADAAAVLHRCGLPADRDHVADVLALLRVTLASAARLLPVKPTVVRRPVARDGQPVSSLAIALHAIAAYTLSPVAV